MPKKEMEIEIGRGTAKMRMMTMIQCGRQTVRVIQPDGQVRQLSLPVSVGDLVGLHPHHYVCRATSRRRSILPLDAQLDSGGIYLLLPVPRLFPAPSSSTSTSSSLHHQCSCSCIVQDREDDTVKCGPSIWMSSGGRRRPWGFNSKISPEGSVSKCAVAKRSRLWEPSLEIILENDLLLLTKDERQQSLSKKFGASEAAKLGKSPW